MLNLKRFQPQHFLKLLQFLCCCCLLLALLLGCSPEEYLEEDPSRFASKELVSTESTQPDPQDTVLRVIKHLEKDELRELLNDIYPASLARYGEDQIIRRSLKIHQDLGITEIVYQNLQELPDSNSKSQRFFACESIYYSKYGEIKGDQVLSFIWHPAAEAWQLEWTPSLILPGLNETGQVRVQVLPAKRGEIFDRQGYPLALNTQIAMVSLVPSQLDYSRLAEMQELLGLEPGIIEDKLEQAWVQEDSLVPLTTLPSLKDVDYKLFRQLGLQWQEIASRSYPWGEALAPLIGYVGEVTQDDLLADELLKAGDLIGKTGLEQIYDHLLRGQDGFRIYISGQYEKSLVEEDPRDGADLFLSIDALMQRDIYELLKEDEAACVAIDPHTAEILAMVSTPAYDPAKFVTGISSQDYNALLHNPLRPLVPKFATGVSPGSTQKLPSSIIGLRAGVMDLDSKLYIEGKSWQASPAWGSYAIKRYRDIDGDYDLAEAIVQSDNIFFARKILDLGAEGFNQGMRDLGAGKTICSDYPFQSTRLSNHGDILPAEEILLADSAYGQGELVYTQAHMAEIYASLLNGGYLKPLKLILQGREAETAVAVQPSVEENEVSPVTEQNVLTTRQILQEPEIVVLREAMRRVVSEQHASAMLREGISLAGKSGTAELGLDENGNMRINSWFVGYEDEHPEFCLALTCFDTQLSEDKQVCHRKFADIFSQLYAGHAYHIPQVQLNPRYSLEDVPPFVEWNSREDKHGE